MPIHLKPNRETLVYFSFYFVAHIWIVFIHDGVFWDDWYIYRADSGDLYDRARQMGTILSPAWTAMHIFLLKFDPWIYKALTFTLMFFSALLLNQIIKRHSNINDSIRLTIVILFLVLPYNQVRPLMAASQYTICYFLFFLAWYLINKQKIISAVLFSISFYTNSLLMFFLIPVVELYFLENRRIYLQSIVKFSIKYFYLLLLPFLYFAIKIVYFKPFGMYENYNNSYDIVRGIKAPILQFANIFDININLGLFALIFIICCWLLRRIKLQKIALNISLLGMAAGVIIFILGAFPYWILGRVPTFNEFSSRHQLLMPLGTAVFWSYCLAGFNSHSRRVGLSVLISLSLAIGMVCYLDLYIDWKKQKQILSFLKKDPISKNSDLVLFEDNSMSMNFNKRELKPYEWNGLLSLAFSDQKRFGLYENELHLLERGFYDYYMSSHFKADQFHRGRCSLIAIISIAPGRIDTRDLGFRQSEFFKDQLLGVFRPEFKISSRYKQNSGTCAEE